MRLPPEITTAEQMFFAAMWRRLSQLFLVGCLAAPAVAQQPNSAAQPLAQPTVSETMSVPYVMIPFTVLGEQNQPLTDLRGAEVNLMIDGVPVPSDMFEKSQNAPVSFTILIDGSGSMGLSGKMDSARAAIGALIAHRRPGDDFSLWLFADSEAHQLVAFTERPADVTNALATIQ